MLNEEWKAAAKGVLETLLSWGCDSDIPGNVYTPFHVLRGLAEYPGCPEELRSAVQSATENDVPKMLFLFARLVEGFTPWQIKAGYLSSTLDTRLGEDVSPAVVNTFLLALKGLATQPDCPTEYRAAVAPIEIDGVWGPVAKNAHQVLESLLPQNVKSFLEDAWRFAS